MSEKGNDTPTDAADDDDYILFEVGSGGTLRMADHEERTTRAEVYEAAAESWRDSPQALKDAMDSCQPLAWEVLKFYSKSREPLASDLGEAKRAGEGHQPRVAALTARLRALPKDDEEALARWLLSLSTWEFEERIVPRIEAWFDQEPAGFGEEDYLPEDGTAQGADLVFFRDLTGDELECLGVEVVEGEHPGSSYYAAELRSSVEEANEAAEAAGLPVRFVRGGW